MGGATRSWGYFVGAAFGHSWLTISYVTGSIGRQSFLSMNGEATRDDQLAERERGHDAESP